MISTLAISNYRSLLNLVVPFSQLTLITGENASGKSNLYKALRLLSQCAGGGVVSTLAREGGLSSTFWAGPEQLSSRMQKGEVAVQGGPKQKAARLRLGFAGPDFSYAISLGLPKPGSLGPTAFAFDPEIKRECIWAGAAYRPARLLVDRQGAVIKVREKRQWEVIAQHASVYDSLFTQAVDPGRAPEVFTLKEQIRQWRFYDHFRSDPDAPARQPQLGTRTTMLHHDGRDLAAAWQTIHEIGDAEALDAAVSDAFPGARVAIEVKDDGRFVVNLHQEGLLRPLTGAELSDGTLRYLLLTAALLTPRPPPLMILNEPETSLHPDLLPALARLIVAASAHTQVWVISHSNRLINALQSAECCKTLQLEKVLGETRIRGQGMLDEPAWQWPDKGV